MAILQYGAEFIKAYSGPLEVPSIVISVSARLSVRQHAYLNLSNHKSQLQKFSVYVDISLSHDQVTVRGSMTPSSSSCDVIWAYDMCFRFCE